MWKRIAVLMVFVLTFSSLGTARTFISADTGVSTTPKVAPDFTLTDIDGNNFSLSDYQGEVVLLDFFTTICPPANQQFSYLKILYREFVGHISIISVSPESKSVLRDFRAERGVWWKIARDTSNVFDTYNVSCVPTLVIIDQHRYICHTHVGLTKNGVLRPEIESVLDHGCMAPVLLVHGFQWRPYNPVDLWMTMKERLEDDGFEVYISNYAHRPTFGNIQTYAKALSEEIEDIKSATGARRVDIVAHSMGGLVARTYIESEDFAPNSNLYNDDVGKLAMLGTPNHGTPVFTWFRKIFFPESSSVRQMLPNSPFLNILNHGGVTRKDDSWPDITNPKVYYYTIAGKRSWIRDDDGSVPVSSVKLDNVQNFVYNVAHSQLLTDSEVYLKVNEILLGRITSTHEEDPIAQQAPTISGKICQGEEKSHEILISNTTTVGFSLHWMRGVLNFTLTTPNGTLIDIPAAESDPTITHFNDSEPVLLDEYIIENPEQGIWKVNIDAVNVSDEGENYIVFTFLNTNITISLDMQKQQYDLDQFVTIKAKLAFDNETIADALVTATILKPDNMDKTMMLYDDGLHNDNETDDGIYGNTYTNTSILGIYDITLAASASIDGSQFALETSATIWVEQYPDLNLNESDITFSSENLCVNETVTISATIHNSGEAYANNTSILFYDGNPSNGILVGEDTINVTAGEAKTASVQWIATLGTHDIYVLISPYNEFLEENYTNNIAFKSIHVVKNWTAAIINPSGYPVVDLDVYNGNLCAASDNTLYIYNGGNWNIIEAPIYVLSIEPYQDRLIIGGKGGLYSYNGTDFTLVFSVSNYIKTLGVYNNTLYAGSVLDNPPTLYYCNRSVEDPANWFIDTDFSAVLNFLGPFGSIDAFCVYDNPSNLGNPVGHWKFDEGFENIAYDSSGNQNDGVIIGSTYTNDVPRPSANFALAFNNTLGAEPADSYVMIPDSPSLRPSSALTVQAWINASQAGGERTHIIAKECGSSSNDSYALWYSWDGYLYFGLMSTPIASVRTEFPGLNVWHHVAGVWDGSIMRLYVDGDEVANKSFAGPLVYDSNPVLIGADDQDGDNIPEEGWIGLIDDVRIYDYARTAEQISNEYSGIGEIYIASGSEVYCYNGTAWIIAKTFDDVYAVLDLQVHNGKLYLATRDVGSRCPLHEGDSGFCGRVIEFDGTNWTTVLDHDYWIYSLETYGDKLYAGTANNILTYDGTDWEASFHGEEGAYYAISLITYDGKIYAGMGNGYIFEDPIFETTPSQVVPEFPSSMISYVLMIVTLLGAIIARKKDIRP